MFDPKKIEDTRNQTQSWNEKIEKALSKNPERRKASRKADYDRNQEQYIERARVWYMNNKERATERNKAYYHRVRLETLRRYGGNPPSCACCGETEMDFLAVDHINGGGNEHRKSIGSGCLYWWIRRNGFPDGFQILCHNCNQSKGYYGICPHQRIGGDT